MQAKTPNPAGLRLLRKANLAGDESGRRRGLPRQEREPLNVCR